jgi:catechol 2,3-dioxygenase-like lactoylglutathione lyase family enzyme
MIDHIGITVSNYENSKAFYRAALAPLGYELIMEIRSVRLHSRYDLRYY